MAEDWESWSVLIRSILISSKKPLTPDEINRDTKAIDGRYIPYRRMNYNSLEEMLQDISGLKVFQLYGKTVVQAIGNDKTAHIQSMVRRQKNSNNKKRTLPHASNTFYMNKRPTTYQTPLNSGVAPINRSSNQYRLYNLSSQSIFEPKKTSTPTSKKPLQIPQHAPFVPKVNLQQRLFQQQTAFLRPVPRSARPKPKQLVSAKNQTLTVQITPQGRRVISEPVVDPRITLKCYCETRQLPNPVYKDVPTKSKNIYSSVMVNCKKYSSYPQEAKTKDDAEKLAAEVALKELMKDDKKSTIITSDCTLVAKRIVDIINTHPSGLFESCVVELYIAQYNESLPSDWLKLVECSINIDVGASNFNILSPANYNTNAKAHPVTILKPENLKLSDVEEFWLQVYKVSNTTNIQGLIIDENHSDKIDELAQEMGIYYNKEKPKASSVVSGKYYAVFDSEWHRVRCIKFDEESQTATVFFIDRGDEDVFSISRLRVLHSMFCGLPAQAVRLSLAGLEIFEDCEKAQTLLEKLLVDNSVYVRIVRNSERFKEVRHVSALSAVLFFERDGEEINVNDFVRNEILSKVVNPLAFLGPEKVAQEVFISYVDESAIFINLKSQGMKCLKTLIDNFAKKHLFSSRLTPVLSVDPSKLYVAKILGEWLRVRIVQIENESTVQVLCIDVGNTLTIKKNDLVLLDDLSEILAVYPEQAVQVRLHKISPLIFNEKMASRLRDLAPKTDVFYMKVVGSIEDIPMVEFYKRIENNYLASLNDTLVLESEMISKDDSDGQPHKRSGQSSKGVRSEFPLKAPIIPPIGSFFEVHITMAAHPGNFKIQPFKSLNELKTLTKELSKCCESYSGPPIKPSSVKVGNMYAVKFDEDSIWYRAYVTKIISKSLCVIYFCDYGDFKVVCTNELQPLNHKFYDLPYQAIKATLHGLTPKLKGDWTVKDLCRLHELIIDKNLIAIIKSSEIDGTSGEMILGLELIDTTTSKDIYITKVLIDENRADQLT